MKESKAYKQAILCVMYASNEICLDDEKEIETLKVLFRALHYAEKREQEGKQ